MKKLLILFVVLILVVSTCLVSACDDSANLNSSSSTSITSFEEDSSSKEKTSRTVIIDNSESYDIPSYGNSSSSENSINYSFSGSNYTINSVSPGDVSSPEGMAISAINMIGTITADNYRQKAQYIENAFAKCALVSNLSKVPNYDSLLQAQIAYEAFKVEGDYLLFLTDFANLPETLNETNFLTFYAIVDAYENLTDEQRAKVDDSIKDRISSIKTEVDALPKPAPVFTTEYAQRTETSYGMTITWAFNVSQTEIKTLGAYLQSGQNDSGLSYVASGEDARIKKTDCLSMKPDARIIIPVGQKYSGNISIVPAGSSDGRYFVLETGGNYSTTTSYTLGQPSSNQDKRIYSKPKSKDSDTGRGPQNFNFTPADLTFVGAPFHDYCLILIAQGGEMKVTSLTLVRGN